MEVWQAALFYGIAVAIGAWVMLVHRRAPGALKVVGFAAPVVLFGAGAILVGGRVLSFVDFLFYAFSSTALVAAFLMITARHPVHGSLWLLVTILSVSGSILLLNAELVAITYVLVHASVILVLYLAAVMMVELPDKPAPDLWLRRYDLACVAGIALYAGLCALLSRLPAGDPSKATVVELGPSIEAPNGNAAAVGSSLFTEYLFAVQVGGLLLLTAIVAGIYLTARSEGGDESEVVQ